MAPTKANSILRMLKTNTISTNTYSTLTTKKISTESVGPRFYDCNFQYSGIIPAKNKRLYFVPNNANKVVSFDALTQEWNEIGDDLENDEQKWCGGVLADNGNIYCNPCNSDNILMIDPITETTTLIPLPSKLRSGQYKYVTSSSDGNGNIYFFPDEAASILKIETSTNTITTLNIPCDNDWRHSATSASNGHIFVIGYYKNYIMDFNPADNSITKLLNNNIDQNYSPLMDHGNGQLYAISKRHIIKINVGATSSSLSFIHHGLESYDLKQWSGSVIGRDNCIYSMSYLNGHIVKYDPINNTIAKTAIDDGDGSHGQYGWDGMAIGNDGNGYCAPSNANRIRKIIVRQSHWLYLKYRLLVHYNRATTRRVRQGDNEADCAQQDHEELETFRQFIFCTNDDEFRYSLEFL